MAKPAILQQLQHGSLLTAKKFPTFIETFNYIVNRTENLKGDADIRPKDGHITIDNTDPEHPVLRFVNMPVLSGGGGGGGSNTYGDTEDTTTELSSMSIETYTYDNITSYAKLHGFTEALDGERPRVHVDTDGNRELKWNTYTTGNFGFNGTAIMDGCFCTGRIYRQCSGISITEETTGWAILTITLSSSSISGGTTASGVISISETSPFDVANTSDTTTVIPLYYFYQGKVYADYRGCPLIPTWE